VSDTPIAPPAGDLNSEFDSEFTAPADADFVARWKMAGGRGPSVVQDTNVPLVSKNAVDREYPLVLARITEVQRELSMLTAYREMIEAIAAAAGAPLPGAGSTKAGGTT
jgi:hypothetical protein